MAKNAIRPRGAGAVRFYAALWAAKLSRPLLKITRHNGTNFPGELALKLCPDFLRYVARPEKIITVTGTDGKTSVNNLICDMLEGAGYSVLSNRLGSNINSGVATSLLAGCTVFNRCRYTVGVLEVDERSSKRVYPSITPDYTVITNLFRDSIMRNGHPEYIAGFLTDSIPPETKLILNGDDLISVSVAPGNPRAYFGLTRLDTDVTECVNRINDLRICPRCAGKLEYEYLRYHHIGRAHCGDCGFESPAYDYAGTDVDYEHMTMTVRDAGGEGHYRLLSDSVFNVYNQLTAIAVMRELGMEHGQIERLTQGLKIAESRYRSDIAGDVEVVMQLSKDRNALACSRVFDYVSTRPGKKELLLMMNNLNDEKNWSENVCWLYDCDFEFLNNDSVTQIVVTGPRAKDYYLRLRLAGVPEERIACVRDELEAAELLKLESGSHVYILYGTDSTCMKIASQVRERVIARATEVSK